MYTQAYLNVVLVAILYQQCSTLFLVMCLSPALHRNTIIMKTVNYIITSSFPLYILQKMGVAYPWGRAKLTSQGLTHEID